MQKSMAAKAGKLVVFEGVDGSGKTTMVRQFYKALLLRQRVDELAPLMTLEPESSYAAGTFIREVLRGQTEASPFTLALAFATNRADHCARFIIPQMKLGKTIICDRYMMSSLVYQAVEGIPRADISRLNFGIIQPDLTFWLDVSQEVARDRLAERGGVPERFDERFQQLRYGYWHEVFESNYYQRKVVTIDANLPIPLVLQQVLFSYDALYSDSPRTNDA